MKNNQFKFGDRFKEAYEDLKRAKRMQWFDRTHSNLYLSNTMDLLDSAIYWDHKYLYLHKSINDYVSLRLLMRAGLQFEVFFDSSGSYTPNCRLPEEGTYASAYALIKPKTRISKEELKAKYVSILKALENELDYHNTIKSQYRAGKMLN